VLQWAEPPKQEFTYHPLGVVMKFCSGLVQEVPVGYEGASPETTKNGYEEEPAWALRGVLGYRLKENEF
jgi:hypothetical protein